MIPDDIATVLPEHAASEQEWQNALRLALPRLLPVKLFRQVPGSHKIERGAWMKGAPVGASDLTGWTVGPREAGGGLRIEIECKHGTTKLTAEQQRWIDAATADGVIACSARYIRGESLGANILRIATALRALGVVA